jgi:NAD(P)-dependent dehydrogenase (short-subunit alcohol dehydrogenase family)
MAKTIVITGASSGIGAAAARQLHRDGHHVVIVGRSAAKTEAVARGIGADHFLADFTRLEDVRKLAAELDAAYPHIDVLANNAGGDFSDNVRTADGFDKSFQVNHLSPFLLTTLLMDKLIASRATLIQTSSVGARMRGRVDLDDLNQERDFDPIRAYGTAKLENILFTEELHRRYHDQGINAVAFHPGSVATNFGSTSASRLIRFVATNPIIRTVLLTSPEKGADQLVWFAESRPGIDWQPGEYYEKRRVAKTSPQAGDPVLARGLWERSEQFLA